jgi:hypothetical protein
MFDNQPRHADDHVDVGDRDVLAITQPNPFRADHHPALAPSDLFISGRAAVR